MVEENTAKINMTVATTGIQAGGGGVGVEESFQLLCRCSWWDVFHTKRSKIAWRAEPPLATGGLSR